MGFSNNWYFDINVLIALGAVIISLISILFAFKKQKITILHDLVKIRFETYKKIGGENVRKRGERIGNFFEYLAILINKRIINKKIAKELFEKDFQTFLKKYKDLIKDNKSWKHLHKLKKKFRFKK